MYKLRNAVLMSVLFLIILGAKNVLASEAYSSVETKVEGSGKVYQSVEVTVNGKTVKKESSQPGKLELKMQDTGEKQATVSFSEEPAVSPSTLKFATPSSVLKFEGKAQEKINQSVFSKITGFFGQFLNKFLKIF